ncbi:hypothetical protein [Streptomyces venezuelae]|uniref:hypothetical protein n=1 Tax=Streptomyces venezuelae TaxID=54571 RepID=UPI002958C368|nr:hypothetical protein [Streptomyces venezuelae]
MAKLVLWDIDHTLMTMRGLGGDLWAVAFEEATGVPLREQASVTGSTARHPARDSEAPRHPLQRRPVHTVR